MWRYFLAAAITAAALIAASSRLPSRLLRRAAAPFPPAESARPAGASAASYTWSDTIAAGGTLYVRNMNGAIRVVAAAGPAAHARARRAAGGNVAPVYFRTTREGNNVYLCALRSATDSCDTSGGDSGRGGLRDLGGLAARRREAARVDWVVAVPAGARVDVSTISGPVSVDSVAAAVSAGTINGDIEATGVRGTVAARTVNGGISVEVDSLPPGGDISLETVNGSVTATLPPALSASVSLGTATGRVRTDFPLPLPAGEDGAIDRAPREITGTLGAGGSTVRLETVTGDVTLSRGAEGSPSNVGAPAGSSRSDIQQSAPPATPERPAPSATPVSPR